MGRRIGLSTCDDAILNGARRIATRNSFPPRSTARGIGGR